MSMQVHLGLTEEDALNPAFDSLTPLLSPGGRPPGISPSWMCIQSYQQHHEQSAGISSKYHANHPPQKHVNDLGAGPSASGKRQFLRVWAMGAM